MNGDHHTARRRWAWIIFLFLAAFAGAILLAFPAGARKPTPSPAAKLSASDRKEAQGVLDALWVLEVATDVGVSYAEYGSRLIDGNFAALKWTRERDPSHAKQFTRDAGLAIDSYNLAHEAWRQKVEHGSYPYGRIHEHNSLYDRVRLIIGSALVPQEEDDLWVRETYGKTFYDVDDVIQGAWGEAKLHAARAAIEAGLQPATPVTAAP
jgi:hypothetical protein